MKPNFILSREKVFQDLEKIYHESIKYSDSLKVQLQLNIEQFVKELQQLDNSE